MTAALIAAVTQTAAAGSSVTHVVDLLQRYGFAVAAAIIVAGELGLPIFVPGEVALLLVGGRLIHHPIDLAVWIVAFGTLDWIATSSLHLVARTGGNFALRRILLRLQRNEGGPERLLRRWRGYWRGHDAVVIFLARMVPVFRMYASLTSGLIRFPLVAFLTGSALAAYLWAALPLTAGYLLQTRVTDVATAYGHATLPVLGALIIAAFLGGGAWWWRATHRRAG